MAHLYGEHIGSGVQNAAWFVVSSGRGCDGLQMQMDAPQMHCSFAAGEAVRQEGGLRARDTISRVKQPEEIY